MSTVERALRVALEERPGVPGASGAWGPVPVDWDRLWTQRTAETDWCVEPIIPAGRSVGTYAGAKVGKSLLALDASAAATTGGGVLGQATVAPFDVVYIDLEMTEDDLRERLSDLGYGPDDDLSRLHYFQLPTLPPLDTDLGGELLAAIAEEYDARLVVVDTMARAVSGEENSADTYRRFYAHTGSRLKAAGRALWRLDHAGKDATQGQRGSSAKVDDLDVVWRLSQVDKTRLMLHRTHSRVPWVPTEVALDRLEEPNLRHVLAGDTWPAGTLEVATLLDELGVPADATAATAAMKLRDAGKGRRKVLVLAALKFRRTQ